MKPLDVANVEKVNSAWPQKFEGSEKFILYSIENHLSVGLFDDHDELIAWSMMYDNGALMAVQVDKNHQSKGYGTLIVKSMSRRIAEKYDMDVIAFISGWNEKSLRMFTKLGYKAASTYSRYVLTKR